MTSETVTSIVQNLLEIVAKTILDLYRLECMRLDMTGESRPTIEAWVKDARFETLIRQYGFEPVLVAVKSIGGEK